MNSEFRFLTWLEHFTGSLFRAPRGRVFHMDHNCHWIRGKRLRGYLNKHQALKAWNYGVVGRPPYYWALRRLNMPTVIHNYRGLPYCKDCQKAVES